MAKEVSYIDRLYNFQILDEKKAKEMKLCENNISIELNVESMFLIIFELIKPYRIKQEGK